MAAASLPDFQAFDTKSDPVSLGTAWKKWLVRFENLVTALNVTDAARKKALLLYYAGDDVHDIYTKLTPFAATVVSLADETYDDAKRNLTQYFEPSKNEIFEVYNFRTLNQKEGELIDQYVVRLKDAAVRCGFADIDKEIKHQIVFGCAAKKVRRKALSDDPSLADLIKYARSLEKTAAQAEIIEGKKEDTVHRIAKPGRYSNRSRNTKKTPQKSESSKAETEVPCYFCGGSYPHPKGRKSCPAFGKTCQFCNGRNHFTHCCPQKSVKQVKMDEKSSDSDTSEDSYVYAVDGKMNRKDAKIVVKLDGKKIPFQIDTGASVNIISENRLKLLKGNDVPLKKSKSKLYPYGSSNPLPVIGWFTAEIETKSKTNVAKIYVCRGDAQSLLGLQTALDLEVVKIINNVSTNISGDLRDIIKNHASRFEGIGLMKDVKVKLCIDPEVTPVANKHRRIPFHLRDKVEAEVNRLLEARIIEPVTEPSGWVSPVVLANKSDGTIRLCVDMTEPNKAIERVRYVMPTVDDIRYQVNGAKYFSKMDLKHGYHQLELHEDSRNITTFSTHLGIARFRRLNFGTSSAAEIFHNEIEKLLRGVEGALNIQDDILIFGRTQKEHDKAVKNVFEKLKAANLTLKKSKCEFSKSSIIFYGLHFSADGVSPCPEKVEALRKAEPPESKTELRSFLGMVNYHADFISNYAEISSVLRKLTHDKVKWEWTVEHQEAFEKVKSSLCETTLLSYFDPSWKTEVVCDGSPYGVAGILTQVDPHSSRRKVVAYASRSLTDAETRYGQIEREALAIHFSLLKFNIFLLGKPFKVQTDHKPLVHMFNNPKTQMPYRIERIRMKLQGFKFVVEHLPGSKNPSDYMSRKPVVLSKKDKAAAKELEKDVNFIINKGNWDAVKIEEVKQHTKADVEFQALYCAITNDHLDS